MTSEIPYSNLQDPLNDVRLPGNLDLFAKPKCNLSVIDHFYERFVPVEPIEFEREVYTIISPPAPGNVYTPIDDIELNLNLQFSKWSEADGKRIAVTTDDQSAPVSFITSTLFKNKDARFNRTSLSDGAIYNTQSSWIINKLTVPGSVRATYQQTEGVFDVCI